MAAFNIELRKSQANKDGKAALRLRISHKNVRRFLPLPIKIHPRHWNDKTNSARKTYRDQERVNAYIADLLSTCQGCVNQFVDSGLNMTSDRLLQYISENIGSKNTGRDFLEFARGYIEDYRRSNKINSYYRLRAILNKLEGFQRDVYFDDLTPEFLRRFRNHLEQHHGNNVNTITKNLGGIRTILFAAIREGRFQQDKNPFFHIKLKNQAVKKIHLKPDEIDAIMAVKLKPGQGPFLARDYFMFSFYMFGLRFSDICKIEPHFIKGDRLEFVMDKTDKDHGVLITPPAKEILSRYTDRGARYVFPILDGYDISSEVLFRKAVNSRNVKVNTDLRKVAKRAGIDKHVSFHIARHSIAGYLKRAGWGIYDISKALGHSSIQQTETYFGGFDFHDLDEKMRGLWD